ncbi:inner membrane protein [Escherichia coli]|uniref:Inner membrane protein CbrB n=1 Tax=Escherichia coli TaxID=562 RepID=A0A377C9D1_ECOLX|nr:inner membrane protein [Escherichia coli]
MSVSRRVIHHGLYFAVLGPLIGVLFLVLYIFFAKEPLVLCNNTGTSIVSLIVDYYGSYSCIVNRRDGRLSAGKDRVTEKIIVVWLVA